MNKGDGSAEQWLETFTKTLRSQLPQGQYILTHARKSTLLHIDMQASHYFIALAPWLSTSSTYKSGAYLAVDKSVGSMIDWVRTLLYADLIALTRSFLK